MRTWCTFPLVLLALALPGGAGEPSPKSEDAKPAPSQAEEGFVPLFPGDSFEGWQGAISGYQLDRGVLVSKEDSGGTLLTKKEYADFILRFEFKLSPGGNNGIALRAPLDGRTSQTGMEIQVLDDTAEKYKNLQPYQYHGSLYGLVPARRGHLKPVGEWNEQEILCQGRHIRVTLNGDRDCRCEPRRPRSGRHGRLRARRPLSHVRAPRLHGASLPRRLPQLAHQGVFGESGTGQKMSGARRPSPFIASRNLTAQGGLSQPSRKTVLSDSLKSLLTARMGLPSRAPHRGVRVCDWKGRDPARCRVCRYRVFYPFCLMGEKETIR
jgi:hypothetical protein